MSTLGNPTVSLVSARQLRPAISLQALYGC